MNGLKEQLRFLADKYETKDFIEADPIQFPRIYCIDTDCAGRIMDDKRLAMFLRWMIRRDSPVDMGIWERCQPEKLIIPLDTHVHKQALKMDITKRKSADMRTAKEITDYFNDIFPGDPAKGDFALFGYGVNNG